MRRACSLHLPAAAPFVISAGDAGDIKIDHPALNQETLNGPSPKL